MRFQVVLGKTLGDLMSLKRTILLVLIGLSIPLAVSFAWRSEMAKTPMSLEMQTHYVIDNFAILLYMWLAGFFLVLSVVATAAGFISKEDSDGTLLLLVTKPIKRSEIVLGKFLALVLNTALLQATVLLLSILVFWLVVPIDPDTFDALMGLLPWMFLYSLLVTIVFGSIAVGLSTLMKSRVKITVVLMLIVMLVFFVGIIPRVLFTSTYERYHLYYPDLGYHLGNTFTISMDRAETGQLKPETQAFMTVFAGTYKGVQEGLDPDIGAMPPSLEMTNYVAPTISVVILIGISVIMLILAMWAIERKEVH